MATILVTGGAGYVGAQLCKTLHQSGHVPVTFDNFSTGWRDAVRFGPVAEGDLRDIDSVRHALADYRPDAVMHLAAVSDIAQSMREPQLYADVNVGGTRNLLKAMAEAGTSKLVFSSTCAVYLATGPGLLGEAGQLGSANVYGETKMAAEDLIRTFAATNDVRSVILRYFNVAGADSETEAGEFHRPETHLVPLALNAACVGKQMQVHGGDYDTPDGTCIRDFVHVEDLARGHLASLDWLERGGKHDVFNLGSGKGFSVLQVLKMVEDVTGNKVARLVAGRRPGDNEVLVAANDKAQNNLNWSPKASDLETMIGDAWRWFQTPGYAR